jgi:putative MATE family efflux protein
MPVLRDPLDRRVAALAVPALGTLAIEPLYVLVDTAIVGRLGTEQLAALGIVATVVLVVFAMTDFLEIGVTPDVAYAHGAGDEAGARQVATDALWMAVGAGVLLGAAVAVAARPMAWLLGGRGAVLDFAVTYLRISAAGFPFVLVAIVGHSVKRGVNELRRPLIIVLAANLVNIVLELLFVFGFHWGMAGSAGSTVIAQVLAAAAFLVMLRPHLGGVQPQWRRIAPVLRRGLHYTTRSLAMIAVWVTTTIVAARVDNATLAANQVLTQLFMFLALGLDALAIPAQSLVAGALGAGDEPQAIRVGESSTRLSLWAALGLAAALAASSPFLPRLFSDDSAVHSRLMVGLLLLAAMQIPGAVAFALDGALIGAHDQRFLARQAVINLIGFAPLAVFTFVRPSLGLAGLWGAQLMWMTLRAAVNRRRWHARPWTQRPNRHS